MSKIEAVLPPAGEGDGLYDLGQFLCWWDLCQIVITSCHGYAFCITDLWPVDSLFREKVMLNFDIFFDIRPKQGIEQTVEFPKFWNAMKFMQRHFVIYPIYKALYAFGPWMATIITVFFYVAVVVHVDTIVK